MYKNNYLVRSLFCKCQDTWAIVACAKFIPELIIRTTIYSGKNFCKISIRNSLRVFDMCPRIHKIKAKFCSWYQESCVRSRYQIQGQLITSHRYCGMQLLFPALDTRLWLETPHIFWLKGKGDIIYIPGQWAHFHITRFSMYFIVNIIMYFAIYASEVCFSWPRYLWGNCPDSKTHGANMGSIWGRQDPGGPHVGPMNFAIWVVWHQTASKLVSTG